MSVFADRCDAGRQLAARLADLDLDADRCVVLALPRGGVPVGHEVALRLGVPLDVFLVRKLGVPRHEELAFGAIASGGLRVLNHDVVAGAGLSDEVMENVARKESAELDRRENVYRTDARRVDVADKTVVLVDDGIATGATMRVAVEALREVAREVIVAVPVAPAQVVAAFEKDVDRFVAVVTPDDMRAIGLWYADFSQTTDQAVRDLLARRAE